MESDSESASTDSEFQSNLKKPILHPYTFRLPKRFEKTQFVRGPPFSIQLDHALAVIWILFSKESVERPLGIVQLQWALNFLKGVKNCAEDIQICIEAIENALIIQYAQMIDSLPSPCISGCDCKEKSSPSVKSRSSTTCCAQIYSSCKEAAACGIYRGKEPNRRYTRQREEFAFSPNYEDIYGAMSLVKTPRNVKIVKELRFMDVPRDDAADKSKEHFTKFLNEWHHDQLQSMQHGLEKLQSLEKFIKTVNGAPQR